MDTSLYVVECEARMRLEELRAAAARAALVAAARRPRHGRRARGGIVAALRGLFTRREERNHQAAEVL